MVHVYSRGEAVMRKLCPRCDGTKVEAWSPAGPTSYVGGVPMVYDSGGATPCALCNGLGTVEHDGPTPLRERVAVNLARLVPPVETEVAEVIGSPTLTPAQRASNLRRYYQGPDARWPSPEVLDQIAAALGVDVAELCKEPEQTRSATPCAPKLSTVP